MQKEQSTMGNPVDGMSTDGVRDQVAALAYDLWLERGCPEGSAQEDWLEAERKVKNRSGRERLLAA